MYSNHHNLHPRSVCRSCKSTTVEVLDLGKQHLSDFRDDSSWPAKYPLVLMLCLGCSLVQLEETTPRQLMYHDRYGFRSGVNEAIRNDLHSIVEYALSARPNPTDWLDIASNDGTLLSFVPQDVHRGGFDPVEAFANEASKHADVIIPDYFKTDHLWQDKFDVITSISMFYDLDDPNRFAKDVASILRKDGVWVIQQNYLLTMLEQNAFDNICHEHVTYFSLTALRQLLERHRLQIIDVELSPVNGGCFRTLVAHRGTRTPSVSVAHQLKLEAEAGIAYPNQEVYKTFEKRVHKQLQDLRILLRIIQRQSQKCFAYGASTRGGTILQTAGIGAADIPYAVERQPQKFGKHWSATGIPIISETDARKMHPEYLLVSPWFFRDMIVRRERDYLNKGGKLIFPLPELEIVDKDVK